MVRLELFHCHSERYCPHLIDANEVERGVVTPCTFEFGNQEARLTPEDFGLPLLMAQASVPQASNVL